MIRTAEAPSSTRPRRPALAHDVAMRLAATEYDRVLDVLSSLSAEAWSRPTVNPGWDVRALATHMLGMLEMSASLKESVRQGRAAGRSGGFSIDTLTALQVEERRHLSGPDVVQRWAALAPRAARARRRLPALARRLPAPGGQQPFPPEPGVPTETWSLGYLSDVINTRDPWIHRGDIAAATGTPFVVTPDHDGVLVDEVVREWASRHGEPYELHLTGPAGGSWYGGQHGPRITMDAMDFCRTLSGRGVGEGLLGVAVPF